MCQMNPQSNTWHTWHGCVQKGVSTVQEYCMLYCLTYFWIHASTRVLPKNSLWFSYFTKLEFYMNISVQCTRCLSRNKSILYFCEVDETGHFFPLNYGSNQIKNQIIVQLNTQYSKSSTCDKHTSKQRYIYH